MKIFILITALILSSGAWANCETLANTADKNAINFITKPIFKITPTDSNRVYFYSAPSSFCKNQDVFLVKNDSVIGYQEFIYENSPWIYVNFYKSSGDMVGGWMMESNLFQSGKIIGVTPD